MQGMRRSGTTIVYDALAQDPRFSAWYEPLAPGISPSIGGGSGAQRTDLFASLRDARYEFMQSHGIHEIDIFNHGAPKDAKLEFEQEFPDIVSEYLSFLFNDRAHIIAKFTRAYCKVEALYRICPDALFVHLVRDPRAVVASYLFGKNQRNRRKFTSDEMYFERRSLASAWSSRPLSDLVLSNSQFRSKLDLTDLERILLIWNHTFSETRARAMNSFGKNYLLLSHEDFCTNPNEQLSKIYSFFGKEVPVDVSAWAAKNVKLGPDPHLADDARWLSAFSRLGMHGTVESAGYL